MKKLIASFFLASVASSAFAIPATGPQPLLGEAHGAETVQQATTVSRNLAENGFDRTPQADQFADDGFDRTPLGELLAEDGSSRTGLGQA